MANPTTFTPQKREKFLKALSAGASVAKAARSALWSRQAAYGYRKDHPDFAAEWDEAIEAGTDVLEDEALRRATKGLERYKFNKDGDPILNPKTGQPYFERVYSDTLLIMMLKARRPEKYRERFEMSGKIQTQNVPVDLSQLSENDLNELETILAKAAANPGPGEGGKSSSPPG